MKIKTLSDPIKRTGFINSQFHTLSGQQDREFIITTMKKIISDTNVTWSYNCGRCNAWLGYKTTVKGVVTFKKFKNHHEAMILGKHNPSCKFRKAVSVLMGLGEL